MKSANPLHDWRIVFLIVFVIAMILWAACQKQFSKEEHWRLTSLEDSIRVKITRIKIKEGMTHVTMKTRNAKYKTVCFCKVPYKEKDIVYIKKPS